MHIDGSHPERDKAWSMPLEQIDVSKGYLFEHDTVGCYFERLRRDDPVHLRRSKRSTAAYWSVTRYQDIMAVDTNHGVYSSDCDLGGIALVERPPRRGLPEFIAMDPPQARRAAQGGQPDRRAGQPGVDWKARSASAPRTVLDGLPLNETFDWVQRVSIELTTQMLATLFDFPFEDRQAADLVVRHGHRRPRRQRPGRVAGRARLAELGKCRTTSPGCGTSASTRRRATT